MIIWSISIYFKAEALQSGIIVEALVDIFKHRGSPEPIENLEMGLRHLDFVFVFLGDSDM